MIIRGLPGGRFLATSAVKELSDGTNIWEPLKSKAQPTVYCVRYWHKFFHLIDNECQMKFNFENSITSYISLPTPF